MRPLPNLDFLRSVAVLTVVIEHILLAYKVFYLGYWQVAWIGVVGVFVFFVHTSLVLMWSMERKPHTLDFYIRRIFRIYPLVLLAIAAILIFHAPVAGTPTAFFHYTAPRSLRATLSAALLIPNLSTGYLPESVMWSLPYEVQMYLLLPVLFFFVRRNFSTWPLLLLWGFTIALCHSMFRGVPHNFILCIPYFLPGIIAYVGFGRRKAIFPAWTFPLALLMLWSAFLIAPGWRVANILCLVLGLTLPLFHQLTSRRLTRASHEIAKYSYGIYLAHPFSIVLGLYLLPNRPLALQLTVILVSLAVFAVMAYHLVEKPMIILGSRLANIAEQRYEQQELKTFRVSPAEIK